MTRQHLTVAHESFSKKMLGRLREKQREGYEGWNGPDFDSENVPRRMHDKCLDVLTSLENCDPQDLIDIANFAMMLHYRLANNY